MPELRPHFAGWERADSIVVNPHKWLFTPMDLSVLYCRHMPLLRAAFSLVPDFLQTAEGEPELPLNLREHVQEGGMPTGPRSACGARQRHGAISKSE